MKKTIVKTLSVLMLTAVMGTTALAEPASFLCIDADAYTYSVSEAEAFKQYDSKYSSTRFGTTTIGAKGCLVTSLAIQLNRSGSWNGNPSELANWLTKNGGFYGNSYVWASINNFNNRSFKYVTNYALTGTNANKKAQILKHMKNGYYCVVSVKNYGHFVAVKPSDDGNNIVMMDPNSTSTDLFRYYGVNRVYLFSSTQSKEGITEPVCGLTASRLGNNVSVTWKKPSTYSPTSYKLKLYKNGSYVSSATVNANVCKYTFRLSGYGNYEVRVESTNPSTRKTATASVWHNYAQPVVSLTLNDLPENGTILAYTTSTGTIRNLYSNSGLTSRMSGSEIWASDEMRILQITNNFVKVSYPAGSRWKTAYLSPTDVFNGKTVKKVSVKYNVNTYAKYNSSSKYGCTYTSDTIWAIDGVKNNRQQIMYNTSSGWKIAWCPASAIK